MKYIWVPRNSKLDLLCACLEMQYTASLTHLTLLTFCVTLSPFFQHIKHVEKIRWGQFSAFTHYSACYCLDLVCCAQNWPLKHLVKERSVMITFICWTIVALVTVP